MTDTPLDIAAAGGTVLTVNKRLARHLVADYDRRQIAAGQAVWPSPQILSLDAWVMRQLQGLDLGSRLLTDAQSLHLWEEVIRADTSAQGRDLLHIPQAARRAHEAHQLLCAYRTEVAASDADEDHRAFLRWRKAWSERLQRNRWLERGDLLPTVTAALAAGRGALPDTLMLAGFDELTPVLHQFRLILEERGCRFVSWEPPSAATAQVERYAAVDMADEIRSCARWLRRRLERDPQARLGVVVPQLADYQALIERIFRAEFDPAICLTGGDGAEVFTLSLGSSLAGEGLVRAALRLLAVGDPLRLEEFGWLLRSPYVGGAQQEWPVRAAADRSLRMRGRSEWPLAPLARALSDAPRMARVVAALQAAQRRRGRRLPGEWAEHFAQLLADCGWPGERALSSREFQAHRHLKEVFGQLASLDRVVQPLERAEALATLNRLAGDLIFQPEGGSEQVLVLGGLEAAGLSFEALWVAGLHDGAFPAAPRPNPFLPLALQGRLRMPHADAVRERDFAERLAHRLFVAAPVVVASWPGQRDGAPLRPSPLLHGLPPARLELAASCDPFRAMAAVPPPLETLIDDRAPQIPGGRPFSGGTRILADQALCPFRAFAHHRLHAERLEAVDLGLDGLARGTLVHGVLERFWRQIDHRDALLQLDPRHQAELLTAAAEATLHAYERRSRCDLPPRLRQLEGRRLVAAAAAWLAVERRREPFRIAAVEQRQVVTVGRLQLRTRIDRIDALADGTLAVIDYKTGRPSPQQWLDPRVTEPQLPLYCLDLVAAPIGAVLFGVVRGRPAECTFKGVARTPDTWPGLSSRNQERLLAERGWRDLDEVIAHWRQVLPQLGDAFANGCATVDPIDPLQVCKDCDLPTLCRYTAQLAIAGDPAATEADHD